MELKHIEERLRHWKQLHTGLFAAYGDLNKLTGAMTDSKLMSPVFAIWEAYTAAVSELIGDEAEWLQWYELECDMGKRPKSVVLSNCELEVKTLRHLAKIIADGS